MKHFLVQEFGSKLPLVASQAATTTNTNGCFLPMDSYAEVMSLLNDDNNDYEEDQPRKKSKTSGPTSEEEDSLAYLFQLDPPVSLDEILGQDQTLFSNTQLGGESSQLLRDIVPQTVTRGTPSVGEGSSNGLPQQLGGNMGVVNPMFSSELNSSNSTLSLPQNNPIFWPPQTAAPFGDSTFLNTIGNSNTQFGSAARAGSDFGNSLTQFQFPNSSVNPYDCAGAGDGNSFSQFQPPSFPVHCYGSLTAGVACASASTDAIVVASAANGSASSYGSHQQFTKHNPFEMRGIDPLGLPSAMVPNPLVSPVPIMSQYNQTQVLPRQPFLPDFKDSIPAWEVNYFLSFIHFIIYYHNFKIYLEDISFSFQCNLQYKACYHSPYYKSLTCSLPIFSFYLNIFQLILPYYIFLLKP